MGQDKNISSGKTGGGSLDGLARRLGDLEESLTVVAGELGVSGMPSFKRIDPDTVYREAMRRAQESIAPLREGLQGLQRQLDELARAQALLKQELAAQGGKSASREQVAALDDKLAAHAARLDATLLPFARSDAKLDELNGRIDNLALRLDTIWERLDAEARAKRDGKTEDAVQAALTQRLAAAEMRLEKIANALGTRSGDAERAQLAALERRVGEIRQALPAGDRNGRADVALEEGLSALRLELLAQLDQRLAQAPARQAGAGNQAEAIAAEVARQLAVLIREAPTPVTPLLSEAPADKVLEANPLVISATERAIVRLTHRLERLEEWQAAGGDGKSGRRLMGRLFQS